MLVQMFGTDASQIDSPLPADCPIYQQPERIVKEVQYRQFARSRISDARMPQFAGSRSAVALR